MALREVEKKNSYRYPGLKPGIRKPGFFRVEPVPDPELKNRVLIRVREKENGVRVRNREG